MIRITNHCRIRNYVCKVNGQTVFTRFEAVKIEWAKQLYNFFKIDYPKFYKMDALSKFAFLGVELLKQNIYREGVKEKYGDDDIALFFANSKSSADVDVKFQSSYSQTGGSPSPALFVYTLPNILIGELSIRNLWYGENLFVIQPAFDADYFTQQCEVLLSRKSKACMCGWVDATGDETDAFIFFVEQSENERLLQLTKENLLTLYNQ